MKILLLLLGIGGLLVGLLLAGQGAGIISGPQSGSTFSSSDGIVYGLVIAAIGILLIGMSSRRT